VLPKTDVQLEKAVRGVVVKKLLILIGLAWLGYSSYTTSFALDLDFWALLLPITYGLSLVLLITSK